MCLCRCSVLCAPFRFIAQFIVVICLLILHIFKSLIPDCCRRRKSLTDRIILITGSGNGLGRSLALRLARSKPILVLWDVNESANLETARLIAESYSDVAVHTFTIDVGDRDAVARFVKRFERMSIHIPSTSLSITPCSHSLILVFKESYFVKLIMKFALKARNDYHFAKDENCAPNNKSCCAASYMDPLSTTLLNKCFQSDRRSSRNRRIG